MSSACRRSLRITVGPDPLDQRPQHGDRLAAPVDQRRAWNVGALSRQDLALAIQREVIVVLGDEDVGEQARTGHAARDRARRRRRLHHPLALPAGLLQPRGLDHLQLRGDELEDLRHVLADQAQRRRRSPGSARRGRARRARALSSRRSAACHVGAAERVRSARRRSPRLPPARAVSAVAIATSRSSSASCSWSISRSIFSELDPNFCLLSLAMRILSAWISAS